MRVLCTLPNCSEEVDGKKYERVEGGMLSEEMSETDAKRLLKIPGYEEYQAQGAEKKGAGEAQTPAEKKDEPKKDEKKDGGKPEGHAAADGAGKKSEEKKGAEKKGAEK